MWKTTFRVYETLGGGWQQYASQVKYIGIEIICPSKITDGDGTYETCQMLKQSLEWALPRWTLTKCNFDGQWHPVISFGDKFVSAAIALFSKERSVCK